MRLKQRPLAAAVKDIHQTTQESMKASTIAHNILLLSLFPRSWRERQVTGVCACACACVRVSYRAHAENSLNDGENQVEQPDPDHPVEQGSQPGSAGGRPASAEAPRRP